MRILHTSDWHFGKTAPRIGTYEQDQAYFLKQLGELIRRERVDAVLCAGDVYDSGRVGGEAIRLYTEAATEICIRQRKTFVVTAGNHDSADRLTSCDELLETAGLYVRGRLASSLEPIGMRDEKTDVYALPFFQPGEAAALFPDADIRTMTDAVSAVLDYIRSRWNPDRKHILMAHLSVSGAELSESDRSAANSTGADGHVVGGSASVRPELFAGFDYTALGHIHKPQQPAPRVCYSGAPMAYSFGREEEQTKGAWIWDSETEELSFAPFVPLHGRRSITCTYAEAVARMDLKETYLRLTLTDRLAGMELLSEMTERFPLLMEFSGMQPAGSGSATSLSSEEVHTLSSREILACYMKDIYEMPLEEDLADLLIGALEKVEKEETP